MLTADTHSVVNSPRYPTKNIRRHSVSTALHNFWPQSGSAFILTFNGQLTRLAALCELIRCKLNSKHTEGNLWASAACRWKKGLGSPKQGKSNTATNCCLWFCSDRDVQVYSSVMPPSDSPLWIWKRGLWVILNVSWAGVLLFEPTGTRSSWHGRKLVTGAVFACALALACLFVFYFITA